MRRILTALALIGMFAVAAIPSEASAAQARTNSHSRSIAHRSMAHRTVTHRSAATSRATTHARTSTQPRATAKGYVRSHSQTHTNANHHNVAYRNGGGLLSRTLGTRLYYSNAFRGMIPGTGYGGFRRPAFGNRGY